MNFTNDNLPLISVLMSVYNGEKYLRKSINSILNQTFTNFEFIIINDGSTDNTANILKSIQDPRIKVINQENKGLPISLNNGIKVSRGKYIARMDADDISLPERLFLQVDFLENHCDYMMVGTNVYVIDDNDIVIFKMAHPSDDLGIKWLCLFDSPFVHSSVMIRKEIINKANNYREEQNYFVEDYDLWSRIVYDGKVANLKEIVHLYRYNPKGISFTKREIQKRQALQISANNISRLINDSSFDINRAFILHCLWAHEFEGRDFTTEQVMKALEDAKFIQQILFQKYCEKNKKAYVIKKDIHRMRADSLYYSVISSSQEGSRRLIKKALVNNFPCLDQLSYWKAMIIFIFGLGIYNNIKSFLFKCNEVFHKLLGK